MFSLLDQWLFLLVAVPALLVIYDRRHSLRPAGLWAWRACAGALTVIYGLRMAASAWRRISEQNPWDFMVYWVQGRAVLEGVPLYQPYAGRIELPFQLPADHGFVLEIMNVGGFYHPHSMPWMALVGLPPYEIAHPLWLAMMALITAACAWGLWRLWLRDDGLDGLLLVVVLFSLFLPAAVTHEFAQLNFALLGLLALYWKYRHTALGGLLIALGFVLKPWFAIFGLHALIERRWTPAAAAVGGFLALSGLAVVVLGWSEFASYFAANVAERSPDWVPVQQIEQSLAAVLARHSGLLGGEVYSNPVFLGGAALLLSVTALLARFRAEDRELEALTLIMVAALICYPATLHHYATLLLFPMVAWWSMRHERPGGATAAALGIGAIYALSAVDRGMAFGFLVLITTWLILAVATVAPLALRSRTAEPA